jgi:hypothetical protein
VKIGDVIRSFPLQNLDSSCKKINPGNFTKSKSIHSYQNLHFRFQTSVYLPGNNKEMIVYKDIVAHEGNLDFLDSIPVPLSKN